MGHAYLPGPDGLCSFTYPTSVAGVTESGLVTCRLDKYAPEHGSSEAPTEQFRAVMDAPADDESLARAAAGGAPEEDGVAAWRQMALSLVGSEEVTAGPWPVRKVYYRDADALDTVVRYLEALAAIGEAHVLRTHWTPDTRSMCAVITWGDWYGWPVEEIRDAVLR